MVPSHTLTFTRNRKALRIKELTMARHNGRRFIFSTMTVLTWLVAGVAVPVALSFLLTTCKGPALGNPEPKYQPPPGSILFTPAKGSSFEVQFYYPENWKLLDDPSVPGNNYLIYDPRIQPAPSRPTSNSNLSYEWGKVKIEVLKVDDPETIMEQSVEAILSFFAQKNENGQPVLLPYSTIELTDVTILENTTAKLEGYPSHQITAKYTFTLDGKKITKIDRDVLLAANGREYEFSMSILESEKDGPFAKGFNELIASIQFQEK
jgi:hypothetical protein